MRSYTLAGTVIDAARKPLAGAKVLAYDRDPLINPDDFLGETITAADGTFRIDFDTSKFAGFLAVLEGSPDVYLILRNAQGKEMLRTPVCKTGKEIEYHIKVAEEMADADAPDEYAGSARRMIAAMRDVGASLTSGNRWNLDALRNANLAPDVRGRLQAATDGYDDVQANFNHLLALLDGIVNRELEESRLGTIGYDGPQVPRLPRRETHPDAIRWPHNEAFRWE